LRARFSSARECSGKPSAHRERGIRAPGGLPPGPSSPRALPDPSFTSQSAWPPIWGCCPLSRLVCRSCERRKSRAAARSQAGAPLSWTSERADTPFVCERTRKAAANERQPQRAELAMYEERAEMLFLCERRRRRRIQSAMREQLRNGRRAARYGCVSSRAGVLTSRSGKPVARSGSASRSASPTTTRVSSSGWTTERYASVAASGVTERSSARLRST